MDEFVRIGYFLCMNSSGTMDNKKFRLLNYIISEKGNGFSACEYVYYRKENLIREISHPAEIKEKDRLLVIWANNMHGSDVPYSINEFYELFQNLPEWDRTAYYQIFDNDKNAIYVSRINLLTIYSRLPYRIVK